MRHRVQTLLLSTTIVSIALLGCSTSKEPLTTDEAGLSWFTNEASDRGVTFVHQSGHKEQHLLPEITGSGVALTDVNGDGWLDLYFVQSGALDSPSGGVVHPNRLYLNRGDGTFELQPTETSAADAGYGMGVAAGDYDNDGDNDLYVTNVGENKLFRNEGDGSFVDATDHVLADSDWGTSAAFLDLDRDGDLDLYHANYLHWSIEIELDCYGSGVLTYCPPINYRAPAMDRVISQQRRRYVQQHHSRSGHSISVWEWIWRYWRRLRPKWLRRCVCRQ